jgi:hypothetical protein
MVTKFYKWVLSFFPKICQCSKIKEAPMKKGRGRPRKVS